MSPSQSHYEKILFHGNILENLLSVLKKDIRIFEYKDLIGVDGPVIFEYFVVLIAF